MSDRTRRPPGVGTDDPDSFLSRWSRRKLAGSEAEPQAEDPGVPAAGTSAGISAAGFPTDADMPPIESLDESSDYSGFLSPKVSEELCRMAMRKLFRSPEFNVRDGLDDYDRDFTAFAPLGDVVTRDMKYRMVMDEARRHLQEGGESGTAVSEPGKVEAVAESQQADAAGAAAVDPQDEQAEDPEA
jgi:hypothetical protein